MIFHGVLKIVDKGGESAGMSVRESLLDAKLIPMLILNGALMMLI